MNPLRRERACHGNDARLRSRSELACARRTLANYRAPSAFQVAVQERMLRFLDAHADALWRTCHPGHLTASALVLDCKQQRMLLTHHRKLERWLQLGGHVDGEANLAAAALREATEESGIEDLRIDPVPLDLDIHVIPARPGEPEHWHYDARFLIWAQAGARERASVESKELGWFVPGELAALGCDASLLRLVRAAFSPG